MNRSSHRSGNMILQWRGVEGEYEAVCKAACRQCTYAITQNQRQHQVHDMLYDFNTHLSSSASALIVLQRFWFLAALGGWCRTVSRKIGLNSPCSRKQKTENCDVRDEICHLAEQSALTNEYLLPFTESIERNVA